MSDPGAMIREPARLYMCARCDSIVEERDVVIVDPTPGKSSFLSHLVPTEATRRRRLCGVLRVVRPITLRDSIRESLER